MERLDYETTMKIYDRDNVESSMMSLDNQRSENNESYKTMYYENTPGNPDSDFEDEQDVKIWIPVSSRV